MGEPLKEDMGKVPIKKVTYSKKELTTRFINVFVNSIRESILVESVCHTDHAFMNSPSELTAPFVHLIFLGLLWSNKVNIVRSNRTQVNRCI